MIPSIWSNGGIGMRGRDDRDEGLFSYPFDHVEDYEAKNLHANTSGPLSGEVE